MIRPLCRLAAAALALAVGITTPAYAHEGDGTIEVLAADPVAPLEIAYRVRLKWNNDGHPAADATVTVIAERAGAASTTPQPMTASGEDGVYDATVRFPDAGDWTVRFTAVTPAATLERAVTVAPPPTTTTTSTTATTAPPPSTTVVAADGEDDKSSPVLPLGLGAAALAVAAAVAFVFRRRR